MKRSVVKFVEERCDGCGLCIPSCAEGAIAIVEGKAKLIDDRFCDGLGACLGECPQDAIVIEEREAPEFDEAAVEQRRASLPEAAAAPFPKSTASGSLHGGRPERTPLAQWPIKLGLLSPLAPFLHGADLVLAADCAAFAHGAFHDELLRGRPLAIACPKLDDTNRALERLTALVSGAALRSIHILKMEVPCCGGLEVLSRMAGQRAGVEIPISSEVVRIGPAFAGRPPVGAGTCPSTIGRMVIPRGGEMEDL
jgi:Pyruvate/2-oxoacid:ferredoxin oxidoreductase delta subunit